MIKFESSILDIAIKQIGSHACLLLCSSGVDSIAMTHYALTRRKKMFDRFGSMLALHFNHNLREENDLMEESFCKFMGDKFPDLTCIVIKNPNKKLKTEDQLRKFRLSYLQNFHSNVILTAHHLDDAVESYILNTIRGHPEYLPMPFVTKHEDSQLAFCKPFLFTKKKDFIEYAEKHDLMKYVVDDSTNKVTNGSRRNLIRNEILPIFKREKVGLEKIVEKRMRERLMIEALK
jgi:tRNA(Ile)-lysidine synthase